MSATPFQPKSLCLVRLSALGDVVLVLPLLRRLQARWPELKVTWLIGKAVYPLLKGLEAEGVHLQAIEKPRRLGDYLALRRQFRAFEFDALLCLQASWRANWLYPCFRAKRKIGFSLDRAKDLHRFFVNERIACARPHLAEGFLQFGEALGIPFDGPVEWRLPVDPEARAWAQLHLPEAPFLAVAACASKPERDWPVERFVELLRRQAQDRVLPVVLLGGSSPRERAYAEALKKAVALPLVDLVGRTRLPQLAAVLERCAALVAPDTGAVHIANALGRPVVGLYAVAPVSRTGPYGRPEYCVEVYATAVRTLQGLDPARCAWAHRVHDPRAMHLIEVSTVAERLRAALQRG